MKESHHRDLPRNNVVVVNHVDIFLTCDPNKLLYFRNGRKEILYHNPFCPQHLEVSVFPCGVEISVIFGMKRVVRTLFIQFFQC